MLLVWHRLGYLFDAKHRVCGNHTNTLLVCLITLRCFDCTDHSTALVVPAFVALVTECSGFSATCQLTGSVLRYLCDTAKSVCLRSTCQPAGHVGQSSYQSVRTGITACGALLALWKWRARLAAAPNMVLLGPSILPTYC